MLLELCFAAALLTASPAPAVAQTSTPPMAVEAPAPSFMSDCNANVTCPAPFSGTASCTGHTSCYVGDIYVICDNVWTFCTCSGLPSTCYDPPAFCQCKADGNSTAYCMRNCTNP